MLLAIYCAVILLASLVGGWIPLRIRLTHKRLQLLLSFVSGVMLGVALLHMLPHALMVRAESLGSAVVDHRMLAPVVAWLIVGFLVMFFVERFFCFHHHDADESGESAHGHRLTWTGAAIGLTVHSLIAGVALAASVRAVRDGGAWPAGFGVFLAIVAHKPFDSMTLGTLMAAGQRSVRARYLVNAAFGLVVPVGAVLFLVGLRSEGGGALLVAPALAFSAGTFLCISLSDLLPELQFHQHDRAKLSFALLLGIALAWVAAILESRAHADSAASRLKTQDSRLLSFLDPTEPMDILIPPCSGSRPQSRSPLPSPVEGGPRSVYPTEIPPIGPALGGAVLVQD